MRTLAFFLAPAMLLACSSSDSPAPAGPTDTGTVVTDSGADSTSADTGTATDTGSATDSGPETVFSTTCGTAPFVHWSGTITLQGLSGSEIPKNVKITSPGCPGTTLTTDADGKYEIDIQKNLRSYIRVTADTAIPAIVGESFAEADSSSIDLVLLPALFKGFLSDWEAGKPAILVKVSAAPGSTGSCAALDGVAIAVKDQPGAKVAYFDDGAIPAVKAGATSTTASGIVAITGMTGASVFLQGTKTGCLLNPALPPLTGKTAIEADFVTEAAMVISN